METHEIISVKIVKGSTLNKHWREKMQIVETDKGTYIDNYEGKQFGFFKEATPGFNWGSRVGERVDGIEIFQYEGHLWINKQ
jgi:hypothetical protein